MFKKYKNIIFIILLFILLCFMSIIISKYFQAFLIAIFLLILTKPIYALLSKVSFFNKSFNALISLFLINLFFIYIVLRLGNTLLGNLALIEEGFYYIIRLYKKIYISILSKWQSISFLVNAIDINDTTIFSKATLTHGARNTTTFLFSYFIGNIISYFILVDEDIILKFLKKFFTNTLLSVFYKSLKVLREVFFIEIKLMIISTIIITIGFYIFSINHFISLGILCGILDILPYVGTIFIFIPLILYKIVLKEYIRAIGLIALYLFILIIRQVLETKYVSKNLKIHPLAVLVSVYIFVKFTGIVGVFLGPIYIIMAKEILDL